MMGSSDEKWKKAAMVDDTLVAEMLLQLNKAATPTPMESPQRKPALPLDWSVRQRRSKPVLSAKKTAQRASPTTPLSWSGATTQSGGGGGGGGGSGSGGTVDGGGSEESSKLQPVSHTKLPETTRSKVISTEATTSKRPRKKKTLAELKEEEISLLTERKQLKKLLATLRVNFDKERETNENLKRMKLDVESQPANARKATIAAHEYSSNPTAPVFPTISGIPNASLQSFPPKSCSGEQKETARFVLPDLNLALEEDYNTEVLCRVS